MTRIDDTDLSVRRLYVTEHRSLRPHLNAANGRWGMKFETQLRYWVIGGNVYCGPSCMTPSVLFRNEQELINAGYTLQGETS